MKTGINLFAIAFLAALTAGCQTTANETNASLNSETRTLAAPIPAFKPVASSAKPYDALIRKYAAEHGVPVDLAHAVVFTESSYNASARGAAGEIGLMQLRLATARGMGYSGSAKALYDPATNIKYGMKYLGKAHSLAAGNTCGTILRYNAGHYAKSMNPISANYCSKVKRIIGA